MPKISFGAAPSTDGVLAQENYNIAGNDFSAYYDGAHKLVFVLDKTLDDRKPNVMLVINSVDDRKWDDILAHDFNLDLETIRPKIDNKYQKLDIEYGGLSVYSRLVSDFNSGADLAEALEALSDFRNSSVRRIAAERLDAANKVIAKSTETISKTEETLRGMQAQLKKLREKLARQKKSVGKEPTKQSAAKILKTESQIDSANEKSKRAKKRIANAKKRLAAAVGDSEIARHVLDQNEAKRNSSDSYANEVNLQDARGGESGGDEKTLPVGLAGISTTIPASAAADNQKTEFKEEPKAENMAEEVKPLFDQDPEILDEEIAFKPIEFNIPPPQPESEPAFAKITDAAPTPPPIVSPELRGAYNNYPAEPSEPEEAPVSSPVNAIRQPDPAAAPEPAPQPMQTLRPASPITGPGAAVPIADSGRNRPTVIYYIMLVLLIALSIFTLWLYQKSTNVAVPEITATVKPEIVPEAPAIAPEPAPVEAAESPFIQVEPVETVVPPEPEQVEETPVFVEPEPENLEPQVPVQPETPVQEQPDYEDSEPTYQEVDIEVDVAPPAPVGKNIAKPAYDVSGQQMFVADENYKTDNQDDSGYDQEYKEEYEEEYHEEYHEEYYD